jgi:hydrogenase nickel incorporation protein HypA/HybF
MHEIGITRRILEVVLERAADAGATRITDVHLEIGEESEVAPQSLEFYWPEVSRATPAEGARLVVAVARDPWACRVVAIDVADAATQRRSPA